MGECPAVSANKKTNKRKTVDAYCIRQQRRLGGRFCFGTEDLV
jgi:hypothetical protein